MGTADTIDVLRVEQPGMLATIQDLGSGPLLHDVVEDAFPGAELKIEADRGVFGLALAMPGLHRPMDAHELSDGTLRYLSLVAALLTPRPPELLVLNEPETSLHGSLIEPLFEDFPFSVAVGVK